MHNAVDEAVGHFSDVESYRRYVRDMSAFRLPLERGLARAALPEMFAGWQPTAVGAQIEGDLDDLGLSRPDVVDIAAPTAAEDLLGVLYVLEGSSLGAQLLYRRAQDLGFSDSHGARHLAVQSGGVARWRGFLDVLEAAPDIDMDRVAEASRKTFQLAETAFKSRAS